MATERGSEMGFYLPGPTKGKVDHLIATHGAERISRPPDALHDIPVSKALICVVDTVTYETANFFFSAVEMALLNDPTDFRRGLGCSWTWGRQRSCRNTGQPPQSAGRAKRGGLRITKPG